VTALPVDLTDGDVRPQFPCSGETRGEGTGMSHPLPRVASERAQKMAHRFGEPRVCRLGERQPAPGLNFPVVHAREPASLESAQGRGGQPKEPFDLHDLALAEDRFERSEDRHPPSFEHLVDKVDVEPDVPRSRRRESGLRTAPVPCDAAFRPPTLGSVMGTSRPFRRLATSSRGSPGGRT